MSDGRDKGDRKATIMIGTPAMPPVDDEDLLDEGAHDEPAPLRPSPSASSAPDSEPPNSEMPDSQPPEPPPSDGPQRTSKGTVMMESPELEEKRDSSERDSVERPSILVGLRKSRSTLYELGDIAQRLSIISEAKEKKEPSIGKQMALSFAVSLTLVLLIAMIFVGGAWRMVLGIVAATGGMSLAVFGGLRALPKLAKWLGPRTLPGSAWMWLSGGAFLLAAGAGTLVWTLSVATKSLAMFGVPNVAPPPLPTASASAQAAEAKPPRADAELTRDTHVSLSDGLVYVPPTFESEDGRFDLIVHFHGNTGLVEQSVAAAGINAILYVINYGESSRRYSRPFSNPDQFDRLLGSVEARVARMGLRNPRIERVALSSWSAGYGALYHILRSRSRLDRVDALLLLDSFHASYMAGDSGRFQEASIMPFLTFAKRAVAGEKLMVMTHSSIDTHGYANTFSSADALLERLNLVRENVDPKEASPPAVQLEIAVKSFPAREKNWMQVHTAVHSGGFHVLGCTGTGKADHIAHLAQMSTSALPQLVARWK